MAFALLPAYIAKKKGRTFWKWWVYSMFLLPVALPHALLMRRASPQDNQPSDLVQAPAAAPVFQVLPPTDLDGIRQRLRQYSEFGKAECAHCGYQGHMGLVKRTKPLHENGLFKFAAFMGGPARNWYAASALMGGVAKIVLECPACGSLWEKQTGDRPSMFLIGR
ncbi:MAG: hypothetical protein LC126_28900 [Bryobacterales bacterium]|nr:hypothetical protein [Bryobacterales bacterium]